MKSLTFNDERICNGMLLKVEAMVLSSIVILFEWSLRLSLKLKSLLTESQKESEKIFRAEPMKNSIPTHRREMFEQKRQR